MKALIVFILTICLGLSCAHHKLKPMEPKAHPEHAGIDPELQVFVDDYVDRAKAENIQFSHMVTAGFKVINHGPVIGVCQRDDTWREIDIDTPFWESAPFKVKMVLIFHELTHCLCNRGHDYAKEKDYPSSFIGQIFDDIRFAPPFRAAVRPGYFEDDCGLSIMTPEIESYECIEAHEDHYMKEMFDRCEPY